MRRFTFRQLFKFKPSPLRLFVGVLALTLGLMLGGLGARLGAQPSAPMLIAIDTQGKKDGREHGEYETCVKASSRAEDRYHNYSYGFSVGLPAGAAIQTPTPPAPQQGFNFYFANISPAERAVSYPPNSYFSVRGRQALSEWESLGNAVDLHLTLLRDSDRNVRVLSQTETSLAGLPASRVVATYKSGDTTMVSDEVIAVGDNGFVYTLNLDSVQSIYERDRPVLDAMQKSFCLQRAP